jgi:hypothetical protein
MDRNLANSLMLLRKAKGVITNLSLHLMMKLTRMLITKTLRNISLLLRKENLLKLERGSSKNLKEALGKLPLKTSYLD